MLRPYRLKTFGGFYTDICLLQLSFVSGLKRSPIDVKEDIDLVDRNPCREVGDVSMEYKVFFEALEE
jgi:hypothetical protein